MRRRGRNILSTYKPTQWQDRLVEYPLRFEVTDHGDGSVTLFPKPGTVVQEGTPVNAANLNNLEQGLASHMADSMPHKTADGGYRWGLRINPDLSATIIYEVVE